MTFHPRERRRLPRRRFIRLTALGAAAAGLAPVAAGRLRWRRRRAAAAGDARAASSCPAPTTRRRCPRSTTSPAIADGLPLETGTLKVYNYAEYISPDVLAAFEEEYGVTVEVTTFTSMDEAIAKLASGEAAFDVFFPTPDRVGKLAAGKLLQPLNQTYLPEPRQRLGVAAGPVLRPGRRVHGAVHARTRPASATASTPWPRRPTPTTNRTTSSGTRPTPARCTCSRTTARCSAMAMLRREPDADVNTEDADAVDAALADVVGAHRPRQRQGRRRGLHRAAREAGLGAPVLVRRRRQRPVLPARGRDDRQHRLLVPARRGGVVGSDTIAVLRSADQAGAGARLPRTTCSTRRTPWRTTRWLGYQPPQTSLDPETRRRRRVRAGAPGDGGRPPGGLRHRPAAAAAVAGRRAGVGRRLVEVHGGRLTSTERVDADGAAPAVAGARRARRALAASPCSSCRSTACWPSPSAASTRSSATRCRCGTRCDWSFDVVRRRSSSGSSRPSSAGLRAHRSCTSAPRWSICFLIGYPVAYYVARLAGRRRGLLLALLLAPFWINYLMRMLAWVNLLQADGYVNDVIAGASGSAGSTGSTGGPFTVVHRAGVRLRAVLHAARCTPPWTASTAGCSRRRATSAWGRRRRSCG